jgi:glycine C-acetyltransferase
MHVSHLLRDGGFSAALPENPWPHMEQKSALPPADRRFRTAQKRVLSSPESESTLHRKTMQDIFEKIKNNRGPLGRHAKESHGYFTFPKLEGEIGRKMTFRGKEVLVWSVNNYLGFANHPEVRKSDAEAAAKWGMAYPMGARMMSGQTALHEKLEADLADFMQKEDAFLLNFGYQGCMSAIEALVDRNDVIVYDSECHACMVDGFRLHQGKRFVFQHNDMESFAKQLERARKWTESTGGGILVATEGVFGMAGDQGKIKEITAFKEEYKFRLFVDDAHGFGTVGEMGRGAGDAQGVHHLIDVYFGTFAKAMATIGAFVASEEHIIEYLRYNMRSQTFAKSLPMPIVEGAIKRLEMMRTQPEHKAKLWKIADALQHGLRDAGFDIGYTNSCVTPVFLKGNLGEATNITMDLRENYGIFCSIVVYPVVPKDVIMLRLIPTAVHTLEDVQYTIDTFRKVKVRLEAGEYHANEIVNWR